MMSESAISRRALMAGAAAAAASTFAPSMAFADEPDSLIAAPPSGFKPMNKKGRVFKVTKGNDFGSLMHSNLLWPKPEVAKQMVERVLMELTGAPNLVEA